MNLKLNELEAGFLLSLLEELEYAAQIKSENPEYGLENNATFALVAIRSRVMMKKLRGLGARPSHQRLYAQVMRPDKLFRG